MNPSAKKNSRLATDSDPCEFISGPLNQDPPKGVPQISARLARRSLHSISSRDSVALSTESIRKLAYSPTALRFPEAPQTELEATFKIQFEQAKALVAELEEDFQRPRITCTEACSSLILWTEQMSDPLLVKSRTLLKGQNLPTIEHSGCLPW